MPGAYSYPGCNTSHSSSAYMCFHSLTHSLTHSCTHCQSLPHSLTQVHTNAGTLPDSWGVPGAFPELNAMTVFGMPLTGTLPALWGSNASLPSLQSLGLGIDNASTAAGCISGPLPAAWGSPSAFQQLQIFTLRACIKGMCCHDMMSTWCALTWCSCMPQYADAL